MKILIIRFSSIGDLVLTTPVVRCVKKKYPDAEIHFLSKSSFKAVLANNPNINQLHLVEDSLSPVLKKLKGISFDLIIDLHKNLRSKRVKLALGGAKYSFKKLNKEKWLLVNRKKNILPKIHIVNRYFNGIAPLDIGYDGEGLSYFIKPDDEAILEKENLVKDNYVIIAAGAAHATKRIPAEKIALLCEKINKPCVIVGGKEDNNPVYDGSNSLNLCGKTNLGESAALIKHANAVISADTGMMHIAAAFQKKIAVIWGNTVPDFGMYPFETRFKSFEVADLKCRPCSKIGFQSCPEKHFNCMMKQNWGAIATYINTP